MSLQSEILSGLSTARIVRAQRRESLLVEWCEECASVLPFEEWEDRRVGAVRLYSSTLLCLAVVDCGDEDENEMETIVKVCAKCEKDLTQLCR